MEVDTLASSMKWAMQPALVLDRVPRNVYLKGRRTSTGCSHSTENDYWYVGKGHRYLTDYLVVTTALVTPCVSDSRAGRHGLGHSDSGVFLFHGFIESLEPCW